MQAAYVMYTKLEDMLGKGEEWLVDADGNVRAIFKDGSCSGEEGCVVCTDEPTLKAA